MKTKIRPKARPQYSSGTTAPLPYTLISGGRLMRPNLKLCGITKDYILSILNDRNIKSIRDVYYMFVDGRIIIPS